MMVLLAACDGFTVEWWRVTETPGETAWTYELTENFHLDPEEDEPEDDVRSTTYTYVVERLAYVTGDDVVTGDGWRGTRGSGRIELSRGEDRRNDEWSSTRDDWWGIGAYTGWEEGSLSGERDGDTWVARGTVTTAYTYVMEEPDVWTTEDAGIWTSIPGTHNDPDVDDCEGDTCRTETTHTHEATVEWHIAVVHAPPEALDLDVEPAGDDDLGATLTWGGEALDVRVEGAAYDAVTFGMAETGSGDLGWYGEDCHRGTGDIRLCHTLPSTGGELMHVGTMEEVVADQTTLFSEDLAYDPDGDDLLTYYLADGVTCVVWGHDPAYYAAFGCRQG